MKNTIFAISILLLTLLSLSLTCGCLGFFEGYIPKAQEYTSADYSINQYKFFIDKYNMIRSMGAMIQNADGELVDFKSIHQNTNSWTRTENDNYEDLRFIKNGYIGQYNSFVSEYNSRMRDLTTNQAWMKPKNFPSSLQLYSPTNIITMTDPELDYK
jgi:hypothetical protein